MSLINDALKKAQRLRTETPFGASGPPMPGGRVTKRDAPMQTQTIMLIVAGSVVLVVLSIVGTVYLLNGKSSAPKTAVVVAPTTPKIEAGPKIDVPLPPITAPIIVEKPEVKPAVAETKPEVKPAPTPAAVVKAEEPKP